MPGAPLTDKIARRQSSDQDKCRNCNKDNWLRSICSVWRQCESCGFVVPKPRVPVTKSDHPIAGILARVAPGGVLRERYRLIERIGEGSQGQTFYAIHEFLSHPCVVKILPHRVGSASDAAVRRLRTEARVGFRVNDPHVIRVLDCDNVEGAWYFVMEYVDGADLAGLTERGTRLVWQQAVQVMRDVAHGLAAIHQAGLIHRDIKPSNLILGTDGRTRVADLGVVGLAESDDVRGQTDAAGTLAYAAPEVFASDTPVGAAADLYSLGATALHLLTGAAPHAGDSIFRSLIDSQSRPVVWPRERVGDVPEWVIQLVLRLLSLDAKQRYESADSLAAFLDRPEPEAKPIAPALRPSEALQPRGVVILPFENASGQTGDEWLGIALADYLGRAVSKARGAYVADKDQFAAVLAREEIGADASHGERLLAAGRLVGAATIVEGRFRRSDDAVEIETWMHRAGAGGVQEVGRAQGPLSGLMEIQAQLLEQLLRGLDVDAETEFEQAPPSAGQPTLAAQKKFVLARQAYLQGDYESAIGLAGEAVELDPEFVEPVGFIGVCCARLGRYDEAAEQYRRCESAAQRRNDQRLLVETQANMGVMHYFKGEYAQAHDYYQAAARTAELIGLTSELAQIHNNLGFVLVRLGRRAEAEVAFLRSIETHKAYGALVSLVGPYNGMGNVLLDQQRHEEARGYYRRALALAQESADRVNVGASHMYLGRCAALQGRFADAKHEFAMALNAMEETSFWHGLARLYEYMADMNLQLGNLSEIERCADKRIELARRHSNRRTEEAAWLQKAEAYRRADRAEDAAACLAKAGACNDSNPTLKPEAGST